MKSQNPIGICETIDLTFGVCVCVCVCVLGISPINTGRILMKLRMEIPVHPARSRSMSPKSPMMYDVRFCVT